jgi:hypothetical protein
VDPEQGSDERNLVLVFDAERKVFVLESVTSQLNFNLRSAPAKTKKQVLEQYKQLRTLHEDAQHGSGDDRAPNNVNGHDDGPADESNPYDYRHFLPKDNGEDERSFSDHAPSDTPSITSKANTPLIPAASKPAPSPKPRSKPQTDPLRQKKRPGETTKKNTNAPTAKPKPKPPAPVEKEPEREEVEETKPSPSDTGSAALSSQKAAASPSSNIIIDGDLIIDMGSPPPSRPFRVNPAHFSSNNTPANGTGDDEDEEMDTFRLPSPAGRTGQAEPDEHPEQTPAAAPGGGGIEDDAALAAEMEAAFEESAREEEEARSQHYHQPTRQYDVPSDDESEVSEEE